eukprot:551564-Prymnesium_polylepis.1
MFRSRVSKSSGWQEQGGRPRLGPSRIDGVLAAWPLRRQAGQGAARAVRVRGSRACRRLRAPLVQAAQLDALRFLQADQRQVERAGVHDPVVEPR